MGIVHNIIKLRTGANTSVLSFPFLSCPPQFVRNKLFLSAALNRITFNLYNSGRYGGHFLRSGFQATFDTPFEQTSQEFR